MTNRVSRSLLAVFVAAIMLAASGPARAVPERVLSQIEIEDLVNAHYDAEINRLKAIIDRRKLNDIAYLTGMTRSEAEKALADKNQVAPIVPISPPAADPCKAPQPLFVRRNSQDTFQLGAVDVPLASAKGASVSVTQDELTHSNTVSINGRVQLVLAKQHPLVKCKDGKLVVTPPPSRDMAQFGYMIAPFLDAQGTTNNPKKPSESSTLQGGVDLQVAILGGPFFNTQYVTVSPYYQSDFRGQANVQGLKASWDPIEPRINLGGSAGVPSPYFDWFWQLRGEYDGKHVTAPGLTGLSATSYQWFGGNVQAHIILFPSLEKLQPNATPLFPALANRIFFNAMANYYWDANSGRNIHLYEGEVGYNLSDDGKSSVSVKYDNGTDKDTLQAMKKYLVGLNFKY